MNYQGIAAKLNLKDRIVAADAAIRPYARITQLQHSPMLSEMTGAKVYLKLENLQATGSFKVRGAVNKLKLLDDLQRRRGVVAASTGNHAAAVAFGLKELGIPGFIFVPETTAPAKLENIRKLGGDVRFFGDEGGATEIHARAYANEHGMTYVSPYNDFDVVAGQGTIGLEIAQQLPEVDAVIASLGGGGLIGGIASYLKAVKPQTWALAASARNSKAMMESVRAGRVVESRHLPTLSDGTAGGIEFGAVTFDLCTQLVDDFTDVTEEEIADAMRLIAKAHHMIVEGSAGVAVAALLAHKERLVGKSVVVVLCGANVDASVLGLTV